MTDSILSQLADMMQGNFWLAPILALVAGVLTSFTPCCLSSIPLIIGYVGGIGEKNTKRALFLSLTFAFGSTVTFIILGVIAAGAGMLLGHASGIWHIILGVLMILMALQTWEIFNFVPSSGLISKNTKKGYIGAFLMGILSGIFSSPCSTPVLVVLLAIVAGSGNLAYGILLMILYSIGNSTLVLIAGTSLGFVQKLKSSEKYRVASNILRIVMGTAMLILGFYMFWHVF